MMNITEKKNEALYAEYTVNVPASDVQKQIDSELGDIDGKRPAYTPNAFAWCDTAAPGPGPAF